LSIADAVLALRAHLESGWTATPVVQESRAYAPAADQAFLLCEIRPAVAVFVSIGAPGERLARRSGSILLHLNVPMAEADPDASARASAAAAATLFEGASFAGLVCGAATIGAGADAAAYWRVTATIPFVFDEIV
jgi:hypothetical protein